MFGVVPKVLWSKLISVDAHNCIPQGTNCVLVQTGRQKILIDTGYGPKLPDKERTILAAESGNPIVTSLAEQGLKPEDIDIVILSHLHFDHAGGGVRREGDQLVTTFPRAEYVVQRREWEIATAGYPELRAAYPQENILPLEASGQLRLVDGDVDIVSGIHARITGGHTDGQMALFIYDGGHAAVYLADACPTWRHLPSLWCMSFDMDLLQARRIKPVLLGEIERARLVGPVGPRSGPRGGPPQRPIRSASLPWRRQWSHSETIRGRGPARPRAAPRRPKRLLKSGHFRLYCRMKCARRMLENSRSRCRALKAAS